MKDFFGIVGLSLGLIVGFFLFIAALMWSVYPVISASCDKYGEFSEYNTKMETTSILHYDCFAETASGKWVSTSLLRGE